MSHERTIFQSTGVMERMGRTRLDTRDEMLRMIDNE